MDQEALEKGKVKMHEFVSGGCLVTSESKTFLNDWYRTDRNPCLVCTMDKDQCPFYAKIRSRSQ